MTPDIPHLTVTQSPAAPACSDIKLDGIAVGFITGPLARALAFLAPVSKAQIDAHLQAWRDAGSPRPHGTTAAWAPVRRQTTRGPWAYFRPEVADPDALFYGVWLVPLDSIVTEPPAPVTERVQAQTALVDQRKVTWGQAASFTGARIVRSGCDLLICSDDNLHQQVAADGTVEVLV